MFKTKNLEGTKEIWGAQTPNAPMATSLVVITFKTILNEKVGYHFCQVILSFWLRQEVVTCMKCNKIEKYLWIFVSEALANPRQRANDPHVENRWDRTLGQVLNTQLSTKSFKSTCFHLAKQTNWPRFYFDLFLSCSFFKEPNPKWKWIAGNKKIRTSWNLEWDRDTSIFTYQRLRFNFHWMNLIEQTAN